MREIKEAIHSLRDLLDPYFLAGALTGPEKTRLDNILGEAAVRAECGGTHFLLPMHKTDTAIALGALQLLVTGFYQPSKILLPAEAKRVSHEIQQAMLRNAGARLS